MDTICKVCKIMGVMILSQKKLFPAVLQMWVDRNFVSCIRIPQCPFVHEIRFGDKVAKLPYQCKMDGGNFPAGWDRGLFQGSPDRARYPVEKWKLVCILSCLKQCKQKKWKLVGWTDYAWYRLSIWVNYNFVGFQPTIAEPEAATTHFQKSLKSNLNLKIILWKLFMCFCCRCRRRSNKNCFNVTGWVWEAQGPLNLVQKSSRADNLDEISNSADKGGLRGTGQLLQLKEVTSSSARTNFIGQSSTNFAHKFIKEGCKIGGHSEDRNANKNLIFP